MPTVLSVLALVVAVAALGVVLIGARHKSYGGADEADLPEDLPGLRSEVAALRLDLAASLRHLAVVRYDAFADTGGHLSWSVAMLDDSGSGMVLTAIHGRQDTRSYAKALSDWESEQLLSPEEEEAVRHARG
ncbi:MAG: DUF4446 family protein [Marmoricola sp.]